MKARARFEIYVVYGPQSVRIVSDPRRSLSPVELVARLRHYADLIEDRGDRLIADMKHRTSAREPL